MAADPQEPWRDRRRRVATASVIIILNTVGTSWFILAAGHCAIMAAWVLIFIAPLFLGVELVIAFLIGLSHHAHDYAWGAALGVAVSIPVLLVVSFVLAPFAQFVSSAGPACLQFG